MTTENYESLVSTVQDAWNGQYDLDEFRKKLRAYQVVCIKPIEKVAALL